MQHVEVVCISNSYFLTAVHNILCKDFLLERLRVVVTQSCVLTLEDLEVKGFVQLTRLLKWLGRDYLLSIVWLEVSYIDVNDLRPVFIGDSCN